MSNRLHVDSVIKSFGGKQVLTDIFISCSKGDIIGLLGRNGSGKSTLLKVIFGSMPAERKFVKVGSKLINNLADRHRLINYLPQNSFLPDHVHVKQLINLYCNRENAAKLFSHPLISKILNQKSGQLSGGEKRFLEVLLIIYSDASYILLDEPFNGIAPIYKDEIKELVVAQASHKGFILTDHDYRNILQIATRTILMFDGGTKEIKDPEALMRWGYIPDVL
jgi:ABC-type lipopolysaccharide export system ATPase subunit